MSIIKDGFNKLFHHGVKQEDTPVKKAEEGSSEAIIDHVMLSGENSPEEVGKVITQVKEELVDPLKDYLDKNPEMSTFVTALAAGMTSGFLAKKSDERKASAEAVKPKKKISFFSKKESAKEIPHSAVSVETREIKPPLELSKELVDYLEDVKKFAVHVAEYQSTPEYKKYLDYVNRPQPSLNPPPPEWEKLNRREPASLPAENRISKDGRFLALGDSTFVTLPPSGDRVIICNVMIDNKGARAVVQKNDSYLEKPLQLEEKASHLSFSMTNENVFYINYENSGQLRAMFNKGYCIEMEKMHGDDKVSVENNKFASHVIKYQGTPEYKEYLKKVRNNEPANMPVNGRISEDNQLLALGENVFVGLSPSKDELIRYNVIVDNEGARAVVSTYPSLKLEKKASHLTFSLNNDKEFYVNYPEGGYVRKVFDEGFRLESKADDTITIENSDYTETLNKFASHVAEYQSTPEYKEYFKKVSNRESVNLPAQNRVSEDGQFVALGDNKFAALSPSKKELSKYNVVIDNNGAIAVKEKTLDLGEKASHLTFSLTNNNCFYVNYPQEDRVRRIISDSYYKLSDMGYEDFFSGYNIAK